MLQYMWKSAQSGVCTVVVYSLFTCRRRMEIIHPWTLQQWSYVFFLNGVSDHWSEPSTSPTHNCASPTGYGEPSARLSLPSWKLGLPTSSPTSDCCPPPLGPRGETHSLAEGGAIPTKGQTFWYSMYTIFPSFTLLSCIHVYRFFFCFLLWRRLVTEAFICPNQWQGRRVCTSKLSDVSAQYLKIIHSLWAILEAAPIQRVGLYQTALLHIYFHFPSDIIYKGGYFFIFPLLYWTLLHLPLHCVGRCWDWTQDSCDHDIGCQTLYSSHSARSHPHSASSHPHSARSHPHTARSDPLFTCLRNSLFECVYIYSSGIWTLL